MAPVDAPPEVSERSRSARLWQLRWSDAGRALLGLIGGTLGLLLSAAIVPHFHVGPWPNALILAVLVALLSFLLRPFLVTVAAKLGWLGSVLLGFFGQTLIIWVVVRQLVGPSQVSFLTAFLASWVIVAVSTLLVWIATTGTDEAATADVIRAARIRTKVSDPEVDGILFVQIDGVPFPVLDWGVRAGTLPVLSRWIRDGTHQMAEWQPQLPATTPASQMGILHGTTDGIPAFRWVDRVEGKVYVANNPADAKVIEARHSNGRGLLADDGVSVGTLFTGDATTAYTTMSAVNRIQENSNTRASLGRYLARPSGLARSLVRSVSEIARERFQAARAKKRDVRPRVHRGWNFAFERAGLNGVLRDLNTSLVSDALLAGRRSIYVNYVDYDAVSHHAGVMQPESLDALQGVDAVLGQLEKVISFAPRKYHIVVLSDHGQSQGAIFADRYDEDLKQLVERLADATVQQPDFRDEGSGTLTGTFDSVLGNSAGEDSVLGRVMGRSAAARRERRKDADAALDGAAAGHSIDEPDQNHAPGTGEDAQFLMFGSGNLGLVYVAGERHRLDLDEISARFPELLPGLIDHPGIGFVVVNTADFGPVALGPQGEHRVRTGTVIGEDPLARFGPRAPEFVLAAASMPEAPDIYVNSLLDDLGEVAAFEGLVGCHGGLGGWQERGMLVWPTELQAPEGTVTRAENLHKVLVGWLESLGHRSTLNSAAPTPSESGPALSHSAQQ